MERDKLDLWIRSFCRAYFKDGATKSYYRMLCPNGDGPLALATYELEGNDPALSPLKAFFEANHSPANCGEDEDPNGTQSPEPRKNERVSLPVQLPSSVG